MAAVRGAASAGWVQAGEQCLALEVVGPSEGVRHSKLFLVLVWLSGPLGDGVCSHACSWLFSALTLSDSRGWSPLKVGSVYDTYLLFS